nr:polysaccharide deacetylase family protein [Agromyces seonyuensis]
MALTFDDGPGPYTDRLLDELADAHVPATFYQLGGNVAKRPDTAARVADAGHELGNHTWDHPDLTGLDDADFRAEIDRTQDEILAATGILPGTLRPPYGASDDRVQTAAGLPLVFWSIDTEDWKEPGAAVLRERALEVERGGIVLLHDIHAPSVDAVPAIVDGLRDAGFAPTTVSRLLGGTPAAGTSHRHG